MSGNYFARFDEKPAKDGNFFAKFDKPKKRVSKAEDMVRGAVGGALEGAAGLADLVWAASPLGTTANALQGAASLMQGKRPSGAPFSGVSRAAAPQSYDPETREGRVAKTGGQMLVNAAFPGSLPSRVANVVVPTATAEAAAYGAERLGFGEKGQDVARGLGGAAGGILASVRVAPKGDRVVNALTGRGKVNGEEAAARAEDLRAAGVQPTLNDVAGESGRRLIRAAGVKSPEAGEVLQANARQAVSTTKPGVMARTREVGPMQGQSADEVKAGIEAARSAGAETTYRPAYAEPVTLTETTLKALSDEPGRAALRRARSAAVARQDADQIAEIDALIRMNPPPAEVSAGTLDRVRIALGGRAAKLMQSPDTRDIGTGLAPRAGMIDDTLDQVPALGPARADYRAKSQAIDVLGKKRQDVFSTDPADYRRWLEGLSPEAREANKVAIRQEVLDTLGGQRSSTMGNVEELTQSQYARENLAAALGDEAGPYLRNLEAQLQQLRNAQFVAPNSGSRTAVLENDTSALAGVIDVGGDVVGRNWGRLGARAVDWLRTRGISDADAKRLAEDAVDPAKLDAVLQALAGRVGEREARRFLQLRNAAMGGVSGGAISAPATPSARERD